MKPNKEQLSQKNKGTVYWVTGLAGAGKTTIANLLVEDMRARQATVIFLDGDVMREVLGGSAGHSPAERLVLARQYAAMCHLISRQGVSVVCATISMFHEVRQWNREHLESYCEIYLKVPLDELVKRDQKGLYRDALAGEIDNVMGVNAPFEEPESPDIMLENNGDRSPHEVLAELLEKINLWSGE